MASHRAERAPRRAVRRSGRRVARTPSRRGGLVGVVVALLAGLMLGGTQGSYAFWTDRDDVAAGTFTTGTLDLTVNGAQGNPTAYAATDLTLSRMVPGESVAATLTIRNAGDASFTWVPTLAESGNAVLTNALDVTMVRATTAGPMDTSYPRTQGCQAGGTPMPSGATAPSLAIGTQTTLCVLVSMPSTATNEVQNLSGYTLTLSLAATQTLS